MKKYILFVIVALFVTGCFSSSDSSSSVPEITADSIKITGGSTPYLIISNVTGSAKSSKVTIGDLPSSFVPGASKSFEDGNDAEIKAMIKDSVAIRNSEVSFPVLDNSKGPSFAWNVPSYNISSETSHSFYVTYAKDSEVSTTTQKLISATNVYTSSHCVIFVANNQLSSFDSSVWKKVGDTFESTIFPKDTELFGEPYYFGGAASAPIVILYYNMDEGYTDSAGNSGILGYFFAADLYNDSDTLSQAKLHSNEMNMFYMNSHFINFSTSKTPDPSDPEMLRTLAHEFQHMINSSRRIFVEGHNQLDTWIDEGMAESAEHYIYGAGTTRLTNFNLKNIKIWNGAPLTVWNDGSDANLLESNYCQAYVFMQYVRLQCQTWSIFKELIASNYVSYKAIEKIIQDHVSSEYLNDNYFQKDGSVAFERILQFFRVAVLLNESKGPFGFMEDGSIFSLTVHQPTKIITSLDSSGSIYIKMSSNSDLDKFEMISGADTIKIVKVYKK